MQVAGLEVGLKMSQEMKRVVVEAGVPHLRGLVFLLMLYQQRSTL